MQRHMTKLQSASARMRADLIDSCGHMAMNPAHPYNLAAGQYECACEREGLKPMSVAQPPNDLNYRTVNYALAPGALDDDVDVQSEEMLVNMGPQHPST